MTNSVSARAGVLFAALSLLGALLIGGSVIGAGPAAAHSGVTGSSPDSGASLDRSPGVVSVTFNEDLRPEYATLKVVGPDGRFWQQGEPTVDGPTISVPVNALGPAGEYKINFRVTSADGHPVQGQRTFTLTVAGDGQPGPVADEIDVADSSSGFPVWAIVLIVVAVLLVLAGVLVAVLRGTNRGRGSSN